MAVRQQVLILCLAHPELDAETVAWALYDGSRSTDEEQMGTGSETHPPYSSVLAAMRDGWRVMQVPPIRNITPGQGNEPGYLPYEYILERLVDRDG